MADQPLILVVDDEPSFREIFKAKFSTVGYRVETADNGEEGVRKAKELKPNLVLMDMKMPGMSGADAVLKLKEDSETKNLKVVFLSNLGDPREEMQEFNNRLSKEVGALGYVKKTDDLDSIVEKIKFFINAS